MQDFIDSLVNQLTTGIITVDSTGHVMTMNPAAENLLGISHRSAANQLLETLMPGFEPLAELAERTVQQQQTFGRTVSVPAPSRDGSELELLVRVSPLESGTQDSLLLEVADISHRYHLDRESALVNQHGVSRRMLRKLAHEIRNPLGGLRGAAQLLERELEDATLTEFTRVIIREADRLAGLMDALLGPGGAADMRPSNIHVVLEHVATIVQSASADLEVVRDYDPSLPEVVMDQNQLTQAILNLLQNSSQALQGSGKIIIRTRVRSNVMLSQKMHRMAATIEIEDDGPGVPEDIADTLFYPLVTGKDDGTGLGLPLAQDLVNRHNGLIEYESIPGRTVFTVLLPIRSET